MGKLPFIVRYSALVLCVSADRGIAADHIGQRRVLRTADCATGMADAVAAVVRRADRTAIQNGAVKQAAAVDVSGDGAGIQFRRSYSLVPLKLF